MESQQFHNEKLKDVKNISKEVDVLKKELANEKLEWQKLQETVVYHKPEAKVSNLPEVIEQYETRIKMYEEVLMEMQSQWRNTVRSRLAEGFISKQLSKLSLKCQKELSVLEQNKLTLQNIRTSSLHWGNNVEETNCDESGSDLEYYDALETIAQ